MSAAVDKLLEQATTALASAVKAEKEHGGGMCTTLGGITISAGHKANAFGVGQNAQMTLDLARRHVNEAALHIRNFAATMPAGDLNAAIVATIVANLTN
jgi:hypothetical protein